MTRRLVGVKCQEQSLASEPLYRLVQVVEGTSEVNELPALGAYRVEAAAFAAADAINERFGYEAQEARRAVAVVLAAHAKEAKRTSVR